MSSKVFINRKPLSKETAEVVLKLFPNGGTFAEENVYKKIRTITTDMLPKDSSKTPTMIRKEIDHLISEELTVIISIEGLTCEKCEKKVTLEDEHQKAMKKLADLAEKEHNDTLNKKSAEESKVEDVKEEKTEVKAVSAQEDEKAKSVKKPVVKKPSKATKKKTTPKKK